MTSATATPRIVSALVRPTWVSVARAALQNLRKGRIAEGGSTITQQLVKNRDLTPKRSLGRKATEAMLAYSRGAALVAQLAEPVAAVAAIGILLLFTALIVRHLLAGRAPECACFGAWSAKPIPYAESTPAKG